MKINACPNCKRTGVAPKIVRVHYCGVGKNKIRHYIQCQSCLWRTKEHRFKFKVTRVWNAGVGTLTTRRETINGIYGNTRYC